MINILYVTTSLSTRGGIEETLRLLTRKLDPGRFKIGICVIRDNVEQILQEFSTPDVTVYCGSRRGALYSLSCTLWVRKVIRDFDADIVHTHTAKGDFHGRIAAFSLPNVKIVTTFHDMGHAYCSGTDRSSPSSHLGSAASDGRIPTPTFVSKLYSFININLTCLNSKVITVADSVRAVYTASPEDTRFQTVRRGYDETRFQYNNERFKGDEIVIGTIGRLVWQKGYQYLLEAFSVVSRENPQVKLVIGGTGAMRSELESFVRANSLESNVQFCGEISDTRTFLDAIDLYVQPSLSEGCPFTILEAMGSGLPIVASRLAGIEEIIEHNKTGILVPPANASALASAILSLINNKDKALQLGEAGYKHARANFTSEQFVTNLSDVYTSLLSATTDK